MGRAAGTGTAAGGQETYEQARETARSLVFTRDPRTLRRALQALREQAGAAPVLPDGDGTGGPLPYRDPDPPVRFDAVAWSRGAW